MLEFQEKIKIRKYLYSKVTLALLVIIILFLLNGVWKLYQKKDLTKDNLSKTASTLENLQAREKMLSSEIERLKTVNGTEAEVRDKYGLVKPGEEVIVVVDKDDGTNSNNATSTVGFWQRIVNWFK